MVRTPGEKEEWGGSEPVGCWLMLNNLLPRGENTRIGSIGDFSWCKHSHNGQFHAPSYATEPERVPPIPLASQAEYLDYKLPNKRCWNSGQLLISYTRNLWHKLVLWELAHLFYYLYVPCCLWLLIKFLLKMSGKQAVLQGNQERGFCGHWGSRTPCPGPRGQ